MARTTTLSPSCKLCRREKEKLFLKGERCHSPKCAITKRNFVPGVHGLKRRSRPSQYGQQLRAKQKAKRLYGVMEKKFRQYYEKATKHSQTELYLQQQLEMRFDNVIYRLGFAISRSQARQIVNHGHILLNDGKMNIPSYQVKIGDTITIKKDMLDKQLFKDLKDRLSSQQLPSWLLVENDTALIGKVLSLPTAEDVKDTISAKQIIEFYSRF
jgi:small subunit ribosomal protein S4